MSLILRCPVCEKHYEVNDDAVKSEQLHCPLCGTDAAASDFSAMMFCPHCRGKLAVSLDMLTEEHLSCPRCDKTFVPTINISLDDDDDEDIGLFANDEKKSSFSEGDFFDKYKIIRLLGRGGMGEVYLAEHLFLHREVALKIMLSDVAKNSVFAKRFIREAKIANKINSPNLIGVFDVGIENQSEMLFIAMEYVNGRNVSEIIKEEGVFDEQTTLEIAYNVINALEIMEEENVVHRDIKPSNIMIDVDGNIKLADLGIAKSNNHAEGDLTLTQDSVVFGTPNYASPEQCRSSHNVDSRSDIYSLGATMYQMVTGEAPYTGETGMEIMLKVLGDATPDFDKLSGLSAGFTALLYDMLQKDPAKRPQNIAELRERIENLMQGEKIWQYKLRILLKKALPILKNIGLAILKAPFALFKRKNKKQNVNDSALRHFFNFILFCVFIVLCGVLAYRHREYLTDRYVEYKNKGSNDFSAEHRRKYNQARTKLAKRRLEENIRKYKAKKAAEKTLPSKPVPVYKPAPAPAPKKVKLDPMKLDSDKDGIPNFIELQHNLNPYDANDAKFDLDNDGISNLQEYKDGTLGKKNAPKNNSVNYNALAESEKLARQEQDKKQTHSPKKQKFYPDSVDGRLARCNDVIADLKEKLTAKSNDKWLKERLEYMQKVKNTVENQKKRYELAKQLKENNRFDDAATNEVKHLFIQAHTKRNSHFRERQNFMADLSKMMRIMFERNIDPNMTIDIPNDKFHSGSIFKTAVIGYYLPQMVRYNIADILIRKHVSDFDILKIYYNDYFIKDEKIVKLYLDYGIAEIDLLCRNILIKKPELLSLLIDNGADVNKKVLDASILHWAVRLSDYETVKKLLMAGADINAIDNNGETPLFWAEKYADDSVKKLLIALGSDTEYCNYDDRKAADYVYFRNFTRAVKRNDIDKIIALLDDHPGLAHEMLYNGSTLLHYAVEMLNVPLVKKLIAMQVNFQRTTPFKQNFPINTVCERIPDQKSSSMLRNKKLSVYKLLLEAGAEASYFLLDRIGVQKVDYIFVNYMTETVKYLKKETNVRNALRIILDNSYRLSTAKNTDVCNARFRVLNAMLKDGKWNLSLPEFNGLFCKAAMSLAMQEKELALLLKSKANINDKDVKTGHSALYELCMKSMQYRDKKRLGKNMPTLYEYVRRIRFLLDNNAEIDPELAKHLKFMPNEIKNLRQIRNYLVLNKKAVL